MAKRGQNLYEISFIGVCVLGIALIVFFAFGGNLAYIFEKSNVANLFSGNRTAKTADNSTYLSNINLSLNGQKFKSPVETVINEELSSHGNTETAGGVGNLNETVKVAQQYITQLTSLLQNPPPNSPDSSSLINSLNAYNTATSDYISQNGATATDPLVQLINQIKIAISLNDQGSLATSLSSNAQAYLNSLPDSQYKNLLNTYVNDLMNLGGSINYTIDSRYYNSLISPPTTSTTITATSAPPPSTTTVTSVFTNTPSNDATAAQVNNMYNTLQNVIAQLVNANGGSLTGLCTNRNLDNNDNCYMNLFAPSYSATKICTTGNVLSGGCWASTIYDLNGNNDNSDWDFATMDLPDGSAIQFYTDSSNCTFYSGNVNNICGEINIDLNGTAGPNTIGKDIYGFWLTSTGIVAGGAPSDTDNGTCIPGNTNSNNVGWTCAQQMINLANSISTSGISTTASTPSPVLGQSSNNLTVLEQLEQQLIQIDNNSAISLSQKAQIARTIEIYREGSYSEILPDSYNSAVLCNSIGATLSNSNSICNVAL